MKLFGVCPGGSSHSDSRAVPRLYVPALFLPFLLSMCIYGGPPEPAPPLQAETPETPETPEASEPVQPVVELPPVVEPEAPPPVMEEQEPIPEAPLPWPEETLRSLSLREKVGQLMMPFVLGDFAPEGTAGSDRIIRLVEETGIGGVIVSVGTPADVAVKLNDLQARSGVPLLVAADLETGAGFRLSGVVNVRTSIDLGGATNFPPLMAVGATGDARLAYEMGRVTAVEGRAVGIHVPFAPVLDVNNNPENPIINTRSFGEDPELVSLMGREFVRGVQEHGAIATGKHFPGHGDTDTDSHLELPVIGVDRSRMNEVELVPFQAAVESGIGAMMTAHIAVPSLNGGERVPSTLSRSVLTDVLRTQLGFEGLVFTDAMDMNAIDRLYGREEATVRALEAGADVILMPPDVGEAVAAILGAVEIGRITEARIDESVLRILRAKEALGLDGNPHVDIGELPRRVGIPTHTEIAQEIADRSITVLRNGRNLLPLRGTRTARVLSVSYKGRNDVLAGRDFNAHLRSVYPRLVTADLDRDTGQTVYDGLIRQAGQFDLVIVSTYVTWSSYSGNIAGPKELTELIQELSESSTPHIVISFGSPYLLADFPDIQAYMLGWSGARVSQLAAAKALFGEIGIQGRAPTRIPPYFEIGDGLQLPAKAVANGSR